MLAAGEHILTPHPKTFKKEGEKGVGNAKSP